MTGEGKSITLAVVSIIFALYGFDVSCACYSDYLSQRDYMDFKDLFGQLGVLDKIFYGTFNQICENHLNKGGKIRDLVQHRIMKNMPDPQLAKLKNNSKSVLLIDEVDVFFSKDFYNQVYMPVT